ncbi:MAG TPA: hypothetical protein VHQ24_09365 [Lachnospiraceae bacterium]|nr:hypothetical protein [Lachnospiraceae bacterium]
MNRVAVYPFDKIARGLIKFRELLDFEICTVIDFIINIGEDAGDNTDGKYAGIPILDDVKVALEGVDTLIINSMSGPIFNEDYIRIYKEYEVEKRCKEMVRYANEKGITIICTHDIDTILQNWIQDNAITLIKYSKTDEEIDAFIEEGRKVTTNNKAHRIAIYATRCCLGKYTTQMYLMKVMKEKNRKIAALITEPVANLYGQYDADPIRHRLLSNPLRYVYYMQALVKQADSEGYEYIVMADQQGITGQYFIEEVAANVSLLKAYNPDSILLVTGYDDENIQDCLDLFRIYCNGKKPLAILIPDRIEISYGVYEKKTEEEIEVRKKELRDRYHIENVEVVSNLENIASLIVS